MTRLHEAAGFISAALRILAIIIVLFLVIPVQAQTITPDWWGIRDFDTVSLLYQFNDDSATIEPDSIVVFYNTPEPSSVEISKQNTEWINMLNNHTGVLSLVPQITGKARMQLNTSNLLSGYRPKQVRYQFDVFTNSAVLNTSTVTSIFGTTEHTLISVEQLQYGWVRMSGIFDIVGQPKEYRLEWIFDNAYFGNVAIDNLYITAAPAAVPDIPEPSSIAILGTGIFGLFVLRKKRS